MSYYCKECGNHNKNESLPCKKCDAAPPEEQVKEEPKKKKKVK
uniref:RanBP2-type domain-containing protein n=1 Tax=viral metagenome TaxID=1070528 RepID=A0A6M3KAG2_9ZZZZ